MHYIKLKIANDIHLLLLLRGYLCISNIIFLFIFFKIYRKMREACLIWEFSGVSLLFPYPACVTWDSFQVLINFRKVELCKLVGREGRCGRHDDEIIFLSLITNFTLLLLLLLCYIRGSLIKNLSNTYVYTVVCIKKLINYWNN